MLIFFAYRDQRSGGTYRTEAPSAPSAGSAAGNQICLGRLLPARYLKFGTFLPFPDSVISPLPPLPDLLGRFSYQRIGCRPTMKVGPCYQDSSESSGRLGVHAPHSDDHLIKYFVCFLCGVPCRQQNAQFRSMCCIPTILSTCSTAWLCCSRLPPFPAAGLDAVAAAKQTLCPVFLVLLVSGLL